MSMARGQWAKDAVSPVRHFSFLLPREVRLYGSPGLGWKSKLCAKPGVIADRLVIMGPKGQAGWETSHHWGLEQGWTVDSQAEKQANSPIGDPNHKPS